VSWFARKSSGPAGGWPYTPDERDRVVWLADAPPSDEGAALPVVLASEFRLFLLYLTSDTSPDWDGTPRIVSAESDDMPVAVIEFLQPYVHLFGPPNDEAIIGHPLAGRGLHPCGRFTVEDSSWLRALERMDAVYERHHPERFRLLTHYVFTFRDSTFECAANDLAVTVRRGSLREVVAKVAGRLE
jgi:hypothetical protein